jgi:hypothetical protein
MARLDRRPHRKKSFSVFPSPAGRSLTKLSLGGNNLYMTSLFPARESLVSDSPAGEGNIEKLFYCAESVIIGRPVVSTVHTVHRLYNFYYLS